MDWTLLTWLDLNVDWVVQHGMDLNMNWVVYIQLIQLSCCILRFGTPRLFYISTRKEYWGIFIPYFLTTSNLKKSVTIA